MAMTTLSSKLLTQQKIHFAKIAVEAVLRLKGKNDLKLIKIIKKQGSSLTESFLANGFLLEKSISTGGLKKKENCTILIANTPMDTDRIKIYGAKVITDSLTTMHEIEKAEKEKMKEKINRILKYKPDVFINRQLV
jgi:T-complex protein 1 subunit beta